MVGRRGSLGGMRSGRWEDVGWRVEKQGMTCKALETWAGGRHDEKDGRKGGHSTAAHSQSVLHCPNQCNWK